MDDHRYHVRTCNSRRGPGYPCDCPYPRKPENPFVALEAENKRLREERDEYERERNQWRADCQQQLIYTTEALQRAEAAEAQLAEARKTLGVLEAAVQSYKRACDEWKAAGATDSHRRGRRAWHTMQRTKGNLFTVRAALSSGEPASDGECQS